jgi:hypothetical protein
LKPGALFLVFCMPRQAVRAPFGGSAETGAGGFRRLLVPILLNGGFGYEDYLRFLLPFGGRPSVLTAYLSSWMPRSMAARRTITTLQRRAPERPLPDLVDGRGLLTRRNGNHRRTSVLTLEGRKAEKHQREFLHQGISCGPSSGSSAWLIMSRSRARPSTTVGCRSNWFARSGGHQAASDFDRGFVRFEHPADRRQGGLISTLDFTSST